jgi:hypothetical protein
MVVYRYPDAQERNERARVGVDSETRARAVTHIRAAFPFADRVEVHPYAGALYAEVWEGKAARIVPVNGMED